MHPILKAVALAAALSARLPKPPARDPNQKVITAESIRAMLKDTK